VGILAFTAGVRPQVTADALICRLQPDGSCLSQPQFPGTTQVGIAGGVEAAGAGGSVRATLGPMLYVGGLRAYGARLQVDAAGGFRHVQLVVGGRGDLVRHGGETLRLGAVELGLRLLD